MCFSAPKRLERSQQSRFSKRAVQSRYCPTTFTLNCRRVRRSRKRRKLLLTYARTLKAFSRSGQRRQGTTMARRKESDIEQARLRCFECVGRFTPSSRGDKI